MTDIETIVFRYGTTPFRLEQEIARLVERKVAERDDLLAECATELRNHGALADNVVLGRVRAMREGRG